MHPHAVDPRREKDVVNDELVERLARAEEALRIREITFQLIVDSIPLPVAVTTTSGEVEAVNQPTLDYFGKTFDEGRVERSESFRCGPP